MVLGVCRRLLRHEQDAEDAFQATFLILARKARSVSRPELLGPWLYRVAYRTALEARARAERRREGPVTDVPAPEPPERLEPEVRAALDEELNRLPEKYRAPLVLCYLEGKTIQDAARALGCPKGTVFSRMARGRDRLRQRLEQRGLDPAGLALTAVLSRGTADAAELPPHLTAAAGGRAPAAAQSLADDVLRGMRWQRILRWSAFGLVVLFATGVGSLAYRAGGAPGDRGANRLQAPAAVGEVVGPGAGDRDEDRLQGKWKIVSMRGDGQDVDLVQMRMPFDGFVFRGDQFAFAQGDRQWTPRTFRLVPGDGPKAMDASSPGPDGRNITFSCLYSLDGDTLTLCMSRPNGPRPTALESPRGQELTLFVCQRQRR
jgi:RNA polymerase sigma factor (sigma-70 family)